MPNNWTGKRVFPAGAKPTRVEGPSDLCIGLFGCQSADELHDLGGRANQVGGTQGQRPFQRGRSPAFPADMNLDCVSLHKSHVFDQQPQHPLAISRRSVGIVPHARQIGS